MVTRLGCIVVDSDPANSRELGDFLKEKGLDLKTQLGTVAELSAWLADSEAVQLVMVNLDPDARATLTQLGPIIAQFPRVNFFVLSQNVHSDLVMEAMHLGAREFVPLPVQQDKLLAGIERLAQLHGMGKRARVIQLVPTAGGCGSTTMACNIAVALADHSRTLLIDLDLARGSVAAALDLRPKYTLADVVDSADHLDRQLLENALVTHAPSGLHVLARPNMPEEARRVQPARLGRLLSILTHMFDYVVLDSMMSMDPLYEISLRAADINVLVMQLNVPSVRNTERFIAAMRRIGLNASNIKVIINRYLKKGSDIQPADVERTLGLTVDLTIPNDFKRAIDSINFGQPLVLRSPNSEVSTRIRQLADMLNGSTPASV